MVRRLKILTVFLLFSHGIVYAATISGKVTDSSKNPVGNVQVLIPSITRGFQTDTSGQYTIDNIAPGNYVLEFKRIGFTTEIRQIAIDKNDVSVDVELGNSPVAMVPITITASSAAKSTLNTPASVSVVEGRTMDRNRGESVVAAIQNEPGVSMIGEGDTVVKPIIRGLNSQEIVIVEDGVRSESEQWGNEHAPEIDPLGTSRIEVMRGANSLLYGSDAIAGVISISHPELPNANLGDGPLRGRFSTIFNSNNNSAGENFEVSGATGTWGYRANLSQMQAGNFHTPQIGEVPNTGENEINGSAEIGFRQDWGGLNASYAIWNKHVELQNPTLPFPPVNNLTDSEFQDLHHEHGVLHADVNTEPARLDITAGYDLCDRKEYDSPDVDDTHPDASGNSPNVVPPPAPHLNWIENNDTLDVKAHLEPMGGFQGTLGVSGLLRSDQSVGIVHLTPSYTENGAGAYLVEDYSSGKFDVTFGARGDQSQYNIAHDGIIGIDFSNGMGPADAKPVAAQTRDYSALTGALGGVYHVSDPFAVVVNVGQGFRNPVPFELFAYGKHEGTGTFEIGDPNLVPETSINSEISLRWVSRRIKGEVGVFDNNINNYITSAFIGGKPPADFIDQSIPVVQTIQTNATVKGIDGAINFAATDWLTLNAVYNMVRGDNDEGNSMSALPTSYLPHVPADNYLVGADFHMKSLGPVTHPYFGVDEKVTSAQNLIFGTDIPTPGYSLTNLHVGGELVVMGSRITMDAGVNNLFDVSYIDFNSILKEFNIGDPGRNIYVKMSLPFGS
ncbi:MAG: TonB-dependent receptor [Endomicrobiales bacterium]|jgi:iron complex outermembrane receptor protein